MIQEGTITSVQKAEGDELFRTSVFKDARLKSVISGYGDSNFQFPPEITNDNKEEIKEEKEEEEKDEGEKDEQEKNLEDDMDKMNKSDLENVELGENINIMKEIYGKSCLVSNLQLMEEEEDDKYMIVDDGDNEK